MSLPRWLERIFFRSGIPFQEHQHLPVFSALHLAQAEHTSGHQVAKAVFLTATNRPVTVVVPASARVDLAGVENVLGEKVELAPEEKINRWFKGCRAGCVPPVRLRSDQVMLMDRTLARFGTILFAAGDPEVSVSMSFRDWYRLVRPGVGRFALSTVNGYEKKPLVLVVEDEPATNQILCNLVERAGFASRGVENGAGALALAGQEHPAAILLDLMLPDMAGFDLYEKMCGVRPIRRPPCLVVTALDDPSSKARGQQLGADAYLVKPFGPDRLVDELRFALADARA